MSARTPPDPAAAIRQSESWLGKVGIGLLLFGVAFLFKYAVDQGWLTPAVRVAFGLALGTGLLVTGIRIREGRRPLSQVLSGGGIGALYITGFAAFQLYALVSHPVAFAFMVSVTLLAFFLSQRQDAAVLSVIGAVGGLGTPFLLQTDAGSLPGLVGYTCLVLGGAGAIYFSKGWRSLLWASFAGGWLIFLTGCVELISHDPPSGGDRWALQVGVAFGWLTFWGLPVLREIRSTGHPVSERPQPVEDIHAHLFSILSPLLALGLSGPIWSLPREAWGLATMGGALVYGAVAWGLLRQARVKGLADTHALVGLLLMTISLCLLLKGDALFFALAAEATALHIIAYRLSDRRAAGCAHLLFSAVGVWLAVRMIPRAEGAPVLNARALTGLAVIAAGAGVSTVLRSRESAQVYRLFAHLAVLLWFLRELSSLPNGIGYVTIAWGIYAVVLLVIGLRLNRPLLRTVAMGTLLLVVGKLFMVDLAVLKAIWRILLFMGFGGLFLVLSYYFRALWRQVSGPADLR
ncbi:MAG: hypothetical protein A3F84_09520 [Candidatus Handelsmanbacteria bacterium RIFCSPLOWO2_12_FULL_64_10]|uniref:DUF2339 domain-containing protein n=1 Tax=Handelsmanbacteria sp. (strain RIFCSPLOWO2_12_FULL_64_10) TaxID=1817868 RepID=A0A1F6C5R3_HANXR|nr:MAG: hypothetical protein A3F84_09520 [Candidatus Handelsmanbacteria bacterium RIFCSPLOWO2_12_FULL_64_10]